jgi:hypothetical protein
MAFANMIREARGMVPKIPLDYAKTLVNRAWKDVRRQNLWSFLMFEANWVSPAIVNGGLATTVQGSSTVTLDATADAAFAASISGLNPPTQRQFRQGISTIYNIWGYASPVLTLDRAFVEIGAAASYSIFQCYYPAPMQDFWTWTSIRDMTNFLDLYTARYTRQQLNEMDPQRTWYYMPTDVVYYQPDFNPASTTYQFPMFELWGAPQSVLPYQLYGLRKGVDLVNPTDSLPPAIGEDCVMALVRKYVYEWAEANKGDSPRNSGPDFKYLIGEAKGDYVRLFKEYRRADLEIVNNWFNVRKSNLRGSFFAHYNSVTGTGGPGGGL